MITALIDMKEVDNTNVWKICQYLLRIVKFNYKKEQRDKIYEVRPAFLPHRVDCVPTLCAFQHVDRPPPLRDRHVQHTVHCRDVGSSPLRHIQVQRVHGGPLQEADVRDHSEEPSVPSLPHRQSHNRPFPHALSLLVLSNPFLLPPLRVVRLRRQGARPHDAEAPRHGSQSPARRQGSRSVNPLPTDPQRAEAGHARHRERAHQRRVASRAVVKCSHGSDSYFHDDAGRWSEGFEKNKGVGLVLASVAEAMVVQHSRPQA